jgi:hypothetical protein
MIREEFYNGNNQRKILDSILSDMRERFPEKDSVFLESKYCIVASDEDFNGEYNIDSDQISMNRWFLYDMLCSGNLSSIKNTIVHEEAHRQSRIKNETSSFAWHGEGWLKEYISMGGKPPEVYVKKQINEYSESYSRIKDSEIGEIIILTDDGTVEARDLINKRSAAVYRQKPFLLVDQKDNITTRNSLN